MQKKIWNPLISIANEYNISANSQCKHRLKWITELKKTLLNNWKAMETVKLTSISVSTKGEKQAGTIPLSKLCPKSAQTVSKCRDA